MNTKNPAGAQEVVSTPKERVAEQTAIRHKLLAGGYSPIPSRGKRPHFKWKGMTPAESLVDDADWPSSGARVEGKLVVLDLDIDDREALDRIWQALPEDLAALLASAPLRRGGGEKIALFVRLADGETPKSNATKAYAKPGEQQTHKLEIFSSASLRFVATHGPHTIGPGGEVLVSYRWDGPSLAEVPLDRLPVITSQQIDTLYMRVSETLDAMGWEPDMGTADRGPGGARLYDLVPEMEFNVHERGEMDLAAFEDALQCEDKLRCSASFKERSRNTEKCIGRLNKNDGHIQIWDTQADCLHRPADLDLRHITRKLGEMMKARGLFDRRGDFFTLPDKKPKKARLIIEDGELREATEKAVQIIVKQHDTMFDMGGLPVVVDDDNRVREARGDRLAHEVERVIALHRSTGDKGYLPIDPPRALIARIEALSHHLRPLRSVTDIPVLRDDGTAICEGYDEATRLLVRADPAVLESAPETTDEAAVYAALATLWAPFREFTLAGPLDRGAVLAAALTAVCRAWLPTAPAFGFDAPGVSNGKTLMCETIATLAGSFTKESPLPTKDDDEVRKVLLTRLREANDCVIFDNQMGVLDSAAFAAVLTSETFSGRILGTNTSLTAPTAILFLLSGNNLTMAGDMPRRVVPARIDAEQEFPQTRVFDFDPRALARHTRGEMIAAALVLIRAAQGERELGRIGSFERWDEVVGQTVAWIGRTLDARFGDPADALRLAVEHDPRRQETGVLLDALREQFGNSWFTAREVVSKMGVNTGLGEAFDMDRNASSRSVGMYLKNRKDYRTGGMRIQTRMSRTKTWEFRIGADTDEAGTVVEGTFDRNRQRGAGRLEQMKPMKTDDS